MKQLVPPTTAICFELTDTLNWKSFSKEEMAFIFKDMSLPSDPDPDDDELMINMTMKMSIFSRIQIMSNLFNYYTISDLFKKHIFSMEDMFDDFWTLVYDPKKNRYKIGEFKEYFEVTIFLRDFGQCFAMKMKPNYVIDLSFNKLKKQPVGSFLLSSIAFNDKMAGRVPYFIYHLFDGNSFIDNAITDVFISPIIGGHTTGFSYDEYEEVLLPPPFDTNCRKYSEIGMRGQDHCYENCFRKESISMTGKLLPSLIILTNETSPMISYYDMIKDYLIGNHASMFGNMTIMEIYNMIADKCEVACQRRDCNVRNFVSKKIAGMKLNNQEVFSVKNYIRFGEVTVSTCLQQYSFAQFLTDIASSLGFWLGVSAFGSAHLIEACCRYFADKNKTKLKDIRKKNKIVRNDTFETKTLNAKKVMPYKDYLRMPYKDYLRDDNFAIRKQLDHPYTLHY